MAYAGVAYLRIVYSTGDVHISLVTSKTKVFLVNPTFGALWCSSARPASGTCERSASGTIVNHLCLDRQYHCFELVDWKPKEIQDVCGK